MINHARTLLLNQTAASAPSTTFFGEEYVPPTFNPLPLSAALRALRRGLFGSNPGRAKLNYRLHELMTLLHASELEKFVTDLDHRITYRRADDNLLEQLGTTVRRISGASASELYLLGDPPAEDNGRLYRRWHINIDGSGLATLQRDIPSLAAQTVNLTFDGGLSNTVTLPGAGALQFRVSIDALGSSWLIETLSSPLSNLGELAIQLERLGDPVFAVLFGTSGKEPYATFRNLWYDHDQLPYKLGGLVLAGAYRADEILQRGTA